MEGAHQPVEPPAQPPPAASPPPPSEPSISKAARAATNLSAEIVGEFDRTSYTAASACPGPAGSRSSRDAPCRRRRYHRRRRRAPAPLAMTPSAARRPSQRAARAAPTSRLPPPSRRRRRRRPPPLGGRRRVGGGGGGGGLGVARGVERPRHRASSRAAAGGSRTCGNGAELRRAARGRGWRRGRSARQRIQGLRRVGARAASWRASGSACSPI